MAKTPGQRRAAIYTRISLDKRGDGVGVERQELLCRKLADAHGYRVVSVFSDTGSAFKVEKSDERGEYELLRAAISAGDVERVYVYSTDRLARRTKDLLDLMELMKPRKVTVHAVDGQGIDPDSANGVLITTILGAIGQQESAHKAERVQAAYQHRAATGQPKTGGRRMFGYRKDGKTIIERESEALRAAARHVIDGTLSLRGICADMRERGLTSTTGREMHPATLRPILRNPYIAGYSTWNPTDENGKRLIANREIVGRGQWPPILDEETWGQLQRALDHPDRKTNHAGNTPKRLLSGLLLCPCGEPMYHRTRALKAGGRFSYYGCKKTRKADPGTTHVSIGADDTDALVSKLVVRHLEQADLSAEIEALTDSGDRARSELAEAMLQLKEVERRQRDLEQSYRRGAIDIDVFVRLNADLTDDRSAAADRVAAVPETPGAGTLRALIGVENVQEWWDGAPLEHQRAQIKDLLTIRIGPGEHGAKQFSPQRVLCEWHRPSGASDPGDSGQDSTT